MKDFLKILFIFCLGALILKAEAQQEDSIREAIKTHITDKEIIHKARDLMRIRLETDNLAECRELQRYLEENYIEKAIGKDEIEALAFLRGDFSILLNVDYLKKIEQYDRWLSDAFSEELKSSFYNKETSIKTRISMASLSQKERDFLSIVLMETYKSSYVFMRDTAAAALIGRFLFAYPEKDEMYDYVQEKIIQKSEPLFSYNYNRRSYREKRRAENFEKNYAPQTKPHGWGGGFHLGFNVNINDGTLTQYLKTGVGFFGGAEVTYKSLLLFTDLHFGDGKIKKNLSIDEIMCEKDTTYRFHNIDVLLGYSVIEQSYFRIIPFWGVSFSSLDKYNHQEKSKWETAWSTNKPHVVIGCAVDYKLGRRFPYQFSDKAMERYFPVRLKYKYHVLAFGKENKELIGGVHQITLSIGFSFDFAKLKTPKE